MNVDKRYIHDHFRQIEVDLIKTLYIERSIHNHFGSIEIPVRDICDYISSAPKRT
jgi:hypothetical protein